MGKRKPAANEQGQEQPTKEPTSKKQRKDEKKQKQEEELQQENAAEARQQPAPKVRKHRRRQQELQAKKEERAIPGSECCPGTIESVTNWKAQTPYAIDDIRPAIDKAFDGVIFIKLGPPGQGPKTKLEEDLLLAAQDNVHELKAVRLGNSQLLKGPNGLAVLLNQMKGRLAKYKHDKRRIPLALALWGYPAPPGRTLAGRAYNTDTPWQLLFERAYADRKVFAGLFVSCCAGRDHVLGAARRATLTLNMVELMSTDAWDAHIKRLCSSLQTRAAAKTPSDPKPTTLVIPYDDSYHTVKRWLLVPKLTNAGSGTIDTLCITCADDAAATDPAYMGFMQRTIRGAANMTTLKFKGKPIVLQPEWNTVLTHVTLEFVVSGGGVCEKAYAAVAELLGQLVYLSYNETGAGGHIVPWGRILGKGTHTLRTFKTSSDLDDVLLAALVESAPGVLQLGLGHVRVEWEGLGDYVVERLPHWRFKPKSTIILTPSTGLQGEDQVTGLRSALVQLTNVLSHAKGMFRLRQWGWTQGTAQLIIDKWDQLQHLSLSIDVPSLNDTTLSALMQLGARLSMVRAEECSLQSEAHSNAAWVWSDTRITTFNVGAQLLHLPDPRGGGARRDLSMKAVYIDDSVTQNVDALLSRLQSLRVANTSDKTFTLTCPTTGDALESLRTQLRILCAFSFKHEESPEVSSVRLVGWSMAKGEMEALQGLPAWVYDLDLTECTWPLDATEYETLVRSCVPKSYVDLKLGEDIADDVSESVRGAWKLRGT